MRQTAVAGQLVGRAGELSSFDNLLAELEQGHATAVVLSGEPGIGKTRLLTELAARADTEQLVLFGSASELERDLPYYVFVDALDEYLHAFEPSRLDALDEDVRTGLAAVFPSLHRFAADGDGFVRHERYRTHSAVRELLERLTAAKPLVLVLDDLHWADSASVDLLGALLHRPPDAAVLLSLAVRPQQIPERLSAAFLRAERAGLLVRQDLGALTREDAGELLGEAIDERTAATLYDESGGNPFYLEQLARWSVARVPSEHAVVGLDVPPAVSAALAEELAHLSDQTRRVLEGAAVIGDPFDPELAAAAAAVDETSALDAVDELLRLDLVHATEVPRRFRFRHPLVRRAVYEAAPTAWRLGAHERAAAALAGRGAGAVERAHHVERAGRQGDQAAIAVLREAGEAALHRAPESAAHWFESALELLPADAPAVERVELMVARAGALAGSGRLGDSHSVLLDCMSILPPHALGLRVRVTMTCAGVEHLLGRHAQAHARLESALAEVGDSHSREAVELMIELAVDSLYRGQYEEMQNWGERAATAGGGERELTAAALAVRAFGAALSGSVVQAKAYCEDAANVIDLLSDEELAARLDALSHLATAEVYLDHFEASGKHAERALAIGRATRQSDLFPLIFPTLGTALWVQGRMAEAAEVFDGAIETARLLDNAQGLVWNLYNRSFAAHAAGDVELALATAQESVAGATELDESVLTGHAAWALAQALVGAGRPAEAAELLLASTGGEELRVIPGGWRAAGLELLTRALLAAGRREEAERAAAAAVACADVVGLPMAGALGLLAQAAVELDSGATAAAAKRALDAAAAFEEVGDAYHASLARMLAGRALAQAGDTDSAAAQLERAATAFDSFGADRYRAEAEQELRRLGRRIHRRTAPGTRGDGLAALTERELQLARLVVERKTNPQIAGELFLSPKTVETHLRNIFRKLGVANRVELARTVERADRAATSASR